MFWGLKNLSLLPPKYKHYQPPLRAVAHEAHEPDHPTGQHQHCQPHSGAAHEPDTRLASQECSEANELSQPNHRLDLSTSTRINPPSNGKPVNPATSPPPASGPYLEAKQVPTPPSNRRQSESPLLIPTKIINPGPHPPRSAAAHQ